jgi:hypothetical protein
MLLFRIRPSSWARCRKVPWFIPLGGGFSWGRGRAWMRRGDGNLRIVGDAAPEDGWIPGVEVAVEMDDGYFTPALVGGAESGEGCGVVAS